jgi:drug/metabolite transporter (DMT)-like permease
LPEKKNEPTPGLKAGLFFGFIAALGQGGGAVLSRKAYAVAREAGQILDGAGNGINAAYQRMTGGIFVTVLMWLYLRATRRVEESRPSNWSAGWPWLLASALAGPALGVSCFQWALMTQKTGVVLPIAATSPLLVIPLTRLVDGEPITRRGVLGGVIAVAGVIGLTLAG